MARLEYCDDAEKRASAFVDPYDAIKVLWGYSSGAHRVLIGYSGYSQGYSGGAHRVLAALHMPLYPSVHPSVHSSSIATHLGASPPTVRYARIRCAASRARMPACALARARGRRGVSQVFYTPAMRRILRRIDDLAAAHPPARLTCVCIYVHVYVYICIDR
jgi:hypothetical protein